MKRTIVLVALGMLVSGWLHWVPTAQLRAAEEMTKPKKVVLIAGSLDAGHPRGTHEYEKAVRLFKYCLDSAPNLQGITSEVHLNGWPADPRTLDDADTIVLVSSGADRNRLDHPLLVGDRLAAVENQMQRGCGLVAIHWTTFVPKNPAGERFLEWIGGYFDYESGPAENGWYSKIGVHATRPTPASPDHPISRGLLPFELREEYYYNIRFRENDPRLVPILATPIPGESQPQIVAWAVQRADGGRGFGFTGGHFYDNWALDNFRRMVLNAIVWTAGAEVPDGGVQSTFPTEEQLSQAHGKRTVRALILTGHQHPAHDWRGTTAALREVLRQDERIGVDVVEDPEFLARPELQNYDVLILNYCNWERPGLSDAAKTALLRFVEGGKGLSVIHFANGAFGDWPEYRQLVRRVWQEPVSSHDPYGIFRVDIAKGTHPITQGMETFETEDELYFRQQGELPIEVLATARSKVTGQDEPMAFVATHGRGRIFQTVLGHAAASIRNPGTAQLIRRGTAWAAGNLPAEAAADVPAAK